jgi:transposase
MVKKYNLDLRCLIYDPTNFFTYIDTFNKCKLPQRGRNKQGRDSLRQVNLGLVITKEFHIPLFHYVYGGNINDVVEFGSVTETLVQRYKMLSATCDNITIVYDKGNNSQHNQEILDKSNYHFVGSLVPTYFKELLEIPLKKFKQLTCESLEGIKVYRTKAKVFNKERTVLITYNDELFTTQMKTLSNQISKIRCQLKELKKKITKSKRITKESLVKQIDKILSKKHSKDIITVKIENKNKRPTFSYEINRKELNHLTNTLFGKTILFTDQDTWTDEEIISAYRGQYKIEDAFKRMKDPYFVCWYPQFHWTDQKIQVHAFYCVLALTLVSLLNRELNLKGINISIPEMLKQLKYIKETLVIKLPDKKRTVELKETSKYLFNKESDLILSATNKIQQEIFDTLNLSHFLPS